ncbi:MAG: SH3 domain-containing protein [Lachnospiraceae bacterium]|nr:SH3 domain-containing protein [Lachnospiraceae bacterium]
MIKDKALLIRDFFIKHSKVAFPVIIVVVVAFTVTVALNIGGTDRKMEELGLETASSESSELSLEAAAEEVPMEANEDPEITALLESFYNAWAEDDSETLLSICDVIEDSDLFRYEEGSKYIDSFNVLEIYTKPGPEEGSKLTYVYYTMRFTGHEEDVPAYQAFYICTGEDGNLYIRRGEISEEINEYITLLTTQDNVVEFNNRINTEYNNLLMEKPEIMAYIEEFGEQVNIEVGERLGQLNASAGEENTDEADSENNDNGDSADGESTEQSDSASDTVEETRYVTATTTVNVRSSDSENADKLGKVSEGTKLELVEAKVNGWSEVIYEGQNGFIKSEYLQEVESAASAETIGTVTATTNINVRAQASENADRLGILAGGDSVDLIAEENGWCKIKYNGQIGYVKSDYVQ